ncbi:MAG: flagellar basal-body MS-ring/collar protein FliF [Chitinispirillaceae bacterium]|nr:flagellar basal-body MS-ring/collar protein FliF [Chitinispirillaceae bacterium]
MSEFFKQLIAQFDAIWKRLSLPQKIITTSLIVFTVLGMIGLLLWSHKSVTKDSGYKILYSNLDIEEAADITDALQKGGYKYKLENEGKTILVEGKQLYEIRMAMAKEGLPKKSGIGYELFDKNTIGTTDYVLKLNSKRALEGEIKRTIEELDEVKSARIHIVIPEPTIFLENQKEAKASVVIKCKSGRELTKEQIRGIAYLVSSSVEGLKPENISIVDYSGKLLSDPFGMDENALVSSKNMELQQNMEKYLENKVNQLLIGVLGPSKAYVKISCDLDFDKVERTLEKYNPESKVVRSEERIEESKKNAPDGDNSRERTLTNYEIDKTIEHIIGEIGNIKRLTISVAVDGRYEKGKDGKMNFIPRSPEELHNIEEIVKNAVGYDLARGDLITVSNIKFDNEMFIKEQEEIAKEENFEFWKSIAKYALLFIIGVIFILFLRSLAKTVAEAMNPPVPTLEQLGIEEPVIEEAPEELKKSSEILERVEILTREEPVNIALIIKQWLNEMPGKKK